MSPPRKSWRGGKGAGPESATVGGHSQWMNARGYKTGFEFRFCLDPTSGVCLYARCLCPQPRQGLPEPPVFFPLAHRRETLYFRGTPTVKYQPQTARAAEETDLQTNNHKKRRQQHKNKKNNKKTSQNRKETANQASVRRKLQTPLELSSFRCT